MEKRLRAFDRRLLANSGFLEKRVFEPVPHCWFCSDLSSKDSNEHVFPRWLLKRLDLEDQIVEPYRILADNMTIGSQRPPHSLSSLTVGNVCTKCNNGWMSSLEAEAQKFLVEKNRQRMTPEQVEIFARWMTKTAVSLNVSMPYRLLFDEATRHAIAFGIPRRVYVFIFKARKNDHEINWRQGSQPHWILEEDLREMVTDNMALAYIGYINLGSVGGIVLRIPQSLDSYKIEVTSNAAQVWPPDSTPTWGSIPRFSYFTDPYVSVKLSRFLLST